MMTLNGQTKTLLAVAGVLVLIYFLYNREQFPIQNEGAVEINGEESESLPVNIEERSMGESMDESMGESMSDESMGESMSETMGESMDESANNSVNNSMGAPESVGAPMANGGVAPMANGGVAPPADTKTYGDYVAKNRHYKNNKIPREDMIKYLPQKDYAPPESDWLKQKFNGRNKAKRGHKRSSYSGAKRGSLGPSEWSSYFNHNNNVIGNSQTGENDNFVPIDESNGGFAVFKSQGRATCGSNQNCEPEDLFDVDKYLPQEVNDDWFEVQPEPISVKNRHLINITKPIGVNTIGTSLRNASWDIRGTPANPKYVVSPFLNSSIEPDTNLKALM
jgi:hypothetical protein